MDDWLAGEQKRAVLRNVAAYRGLCERVRGGANSGLIFGVIMLALWYFIFGQNNDYRVLSLIYLGLGGLEFTVALWNKFRPSAEGVLMEGLVLMAFGVASLVRQLLLGMLSPFILLAVYWLWAGFSHVQNYAQLRRAFAQRPTAAHLRWFDELLHEVRRADPAEDSSALDLPTRPPVRGKLLGDTAVFLQSGSDDVIVVARDEVVIEREPPKGQDRDPTGYLLIEGADFGGFPLDPVNWRNYAAWKSEGGQPPPPMGARAAADPDLE